MSSDELQHCPLCATEVYPSKRYPRHLCSTCSQKAADENGRPLRFYNESISGGFIAKYADTGEPRDSHVCYINGHECWADEEYMGGIVIQPVQNGQGIT